MKNRLIIAFIVSMIATSCNNAHEYNSEKDSGFVEISKAQFESEKMTMGVPEYHSFADKVHVTGTIIPTVKGQAQIGLPLPGIIENILCEPDQMIYKGSVLFEISGNWFIDLQKDFSESSAILSKLQSEYQRAKELYNENINTQKEYTSAESNYYAENAKHKALKTKLENMGLEVAKIEKGEFYRSFPIKSPINGFVSSIVASLGQFIEPQQIIAEIIDYNSYQLKLNVFENDIVKIDKGQTVEFYLYSNKVQKYQATIITVGKTIKQESKSMECYATINKNQNINLISNQFAEGEVFITIDSVLSVPETAIINSENEQYILLFEKEENAIIYFKKIKISTGRKSNNFIELTPQMPQKKMLLSGTYNIVIE